MPKKNHSEIQMGIPPPDYVEALPPQPINNCDCKCPNITCRGKTILSLITFNLLCILIIAVCTYYQINGSTTFTDTTHGNITNISNVGDKIITYQFNLLREYTYKPNELVTYNGLFQNVDNIPYQINETVIVYYDHRNPNINSHTNNHIGVDERITVTFIVLATITFIINCIIVFIPICDKNFEKNCIGE